MPQITNAERFIIGYYKDIILFILVISLIGCTAKTDSFEEILFHQDSYSVFENEEELLEIYNSFHSHPVWLKHKLSLDSVASLMEIKTLLDEKFCERGLIYIHLPEVSEKTFLRLYPACDWLANQNPKTINDLQSAYDKEDLKTLFKVTREATNNKPPVFSIYLANLKFPVQELENRLTKLVKAYKELIVEESNKPLNELKMEEKELLVEKYPLIVLIN